jgi:ferredoxin
VRLIANYEVCESHGQCALVDDKLFTLDKEGYISIGAGKEIAPADEAKALRGAGACPRQALRLEE